MIEPTNRQLDYFTDAFGEIVTREQAIKRYGIHAVHRAEHGLSSVVKPIDPIHYARGH